MEVDTAVSIPSSSSPSKSFQALVEECTLEEKHMRSFRKHFQLPDETKIHLPRRDKKACAFAHGHVCFYEVDFLCGLCFPIHSFIHELLDYFKITLGQFVPNT